MATQREIAPIITTMSERLLLSAREVAEIIPLHPDSILRLHRLGKFPRAVKVGLRKLCWRREQIEAWLLRSQRRQLRQSEQKRRNGGAGRTAPTNGDRA